MLKMHVRCVRGSIPTIIDAIHLSLALLQFVLLLRQRVAVDLLRCVVIKKTACGLQRGSVLYNDGAPKDPALVGDELAAQRNKLRSSTADCDSTSTMSCLICHKYIV